MLILPFHVFATLGILYLMKPFSPKLKEGSLAIAGRIFDLLAFAACIIIIYHYYIDTARIQYRMEGIDAVFFGDLFAFCVGVPLLLEGVRRTSGNGLVAVITIAIIYALFGNYFPGWFRFKGFSLETFAELTVLGTEGLYGVTASSITSFVFYFVAFGAIFSAFGGGKIFIDLAMRVTGRMVGGPAKSAIVASALFGTISGSAIANVTSTGVLTIPLMKRAGYTPEQAAATEAIASTGGQLMPPIMGVAAFIMADLLGVPYLTVALAGTIPAIAFYFALYLNIDLLARKKQIHGISEAELNMDTDPLMPRFHLLLGPILLLFALVMDYSAPMSALVGSAAALLSPFLSRKTWYKPIDFYRAFSAIGKQMADVSIAVSAIGIIIVVAIQSGIAIKFVTLLAELGQDSLYLSLFLVILGCLILGMGLPTTAAYVIAAVMFVPALGKLGVDKMPSHFFVFYYSVLSMVTPPVALAAFAAAAIAKADAHKTGLIGFGLGLAIFILPFGFINDPALLWQGSWHTILIACFGIVCATGSWAIALQGWLWGKLGIVFRLTFTLCCFIIVHEPTFSTGWSIALSVFIILVVYRRMNKIKNMQIATA